MKMSYEQLNEYYRTVNKKVLVRLKEDRQVLSNGMAIQETRGKKDIVSGIAEVAQPSLKISPRSLVWFPMYSALPINLNGEVFYIVDYEDIVIIENVED